MIEERNDLAGIKGDLNHLKELSRLVEEGRRMPLVGSAVHLLWGGVIAGVASVHLILLSSGTNPQTLLLLWIVSLTAAAVGTFAILARMGGDRHASIERNVASGNIWVVSTVACGLFFATSAMFEPTAVALTPAVAAFVFAVTTAAGATMYRSNMMRWQAIGWLVFGTFYMAADEPHLRIAALAFSAVLLLVVPGLVLRRKEVEWR